MDWVSSEGASQKATTPSRAEAAPRPQENDPRLTEPRDGGSGWAQWAAARSNQLTEPNSLSTDSSQACLPPQALAILGGDPPSALSDTPQNAGRPPSPCPDSHFYSSEPAPPAREAPLIS